MQSVNATSLYCVSVVRHVADFTTDNGGPSVVYSADIFGSGVLGVADTSHIGHTLSNLRFCLDLQTQGK